jgi:hypothetical protein
MPRAGLKAFGSWRWLPFVPTLLLLVLVPSPRHGGGFQTGALAEEIRESAIAGTWYPSSPVELRRQVAGFLDQAPAAQASGRIVALVAPHAGYAYSGQVAAHAYKQITSERAFDTVVVIAPSHRIRFSGVAVYDRGGFRTPLGVVPLDRELIDALKKRDPRIRYVPEAHSQEHALEIQLPFLQVLLPAAKLVPLLMGDQDWATCQWLSEAIAETVRGKSVLVVASTDLSHFHAAEAARRLDHGVVERVSAFDPQGLSRDLGSGRCEACGGGPLVAAMLAARKLGADHARVLEYAHSGDVTGEQGRVVGYMAAALWAGSGGGDGKEPSLDGRPAIASGLTPEEKGELHRMARKSIEARFRREDPPRLQLDSPRLKEPRGAFVTLKKRGELRGCIGHIVATDPLGQTVSEMAAAAAFQDPRFPALTEGELGDLEIEISVLTPLQRIHRPEEITVGVHGIYLKRGGRSGLLLPQVATEQGWDRTAFLEGTCRKAGLPADAWKDPETEIYIFSADVF